MVLKFLLFKAIVRSRARVFLPDAIHLRSNKSNNIVVAEILFVAAQGTNLIADH